MECAADELAAPEGGGDMQESEAAHDSTPDPESELELEYAGDEPSAAVAAAVHETECSPADMPVEGGAVPTTMAVRWRGEEEATPKAEDSTPQPEESTPTAPIRENILTIDRGDYVDNPDDTAAIIWHDIQNANRTKRILTGTLDAIERNEAGRCVAIIEHRGLRVAIPASEMNISLRAAPEGRYGPINLRLEKMLNNMLGAEIDFVVKGIDGRSRSVVASRKDAMHRKARSFYFPLPGAEQPMIYPGRLVQVRVLAVGAKVIRVDVFGVEHTMLARTLSWDWVGDARDRYQVGDELIVKVLSVRGTSPDDLAVEISARDTTDNTARQALAECKIQGKYAGTITDIRKGVVYIRLNTGDNAIAHACYDTRRPGRKDDVSFVCTEIDRETGVALGLISRIIKRNL